MEGDKLKTYYKVLANFPFSMNWDNKIPTKDPYNRFMFGIPPEKDKADFAFIQHMFSSLNHAGKLLLPGLRVFYLEAAKKKLFEGMIKEDVIEGIVALPPKLFYGRGIPGCVLILNSSN